MVSANHEKWRSKYCSLTIHFGLVGQIAEFADEGYCAPSLRMLGATWLVNVWSYAVLPVGGGSDLVFCHRHTDTSPEDQVVIDPEGCFNQYPGEALSLGLYLILLLIPGQCSLCRKSFGMVVPDPSENPIPDHPGRFCLAGSLF